MPRKEDYVYIYIDKRLEPFLEELAKKPKVEIELIKRGFKVDSRGVAKYAVYKLLEDMEAFQPREDTPQHSTNP